MGWVIIKAGYQCNNRCVFCHSHLLQQLPSLGPGALQRILARAAAAGFQGVWLSGGEPSLRKDLLSLAARCRELGLGLGLVTNGRMLAYRGLLQELLALGLSRVHLSLHGLPALHDQLVQVPGAGAQALGALELLAGEGAVDCTVNTVVCLPNLAGLDALALHPALGQHRWKLSGLEPKGLALSDAAGLLAHPGAAAAAIRRAFQVAKDRRRPPRELLWDGLPCCVMSEDLDRLRTMPDFDIVAMVEADEVRFHPVDYRNACRVPACEGCTQGRCLGWWCGAWGLHPDFRPSPMIPSPGASPRAERRGP